MTIESIVKNFDVLLQEKKDKYKTLYSKHTTSDLHHNTFYDMVILHQTYRTEFNKYLTE